MPRIVKNRKWWVIIASSLALAMIFVDMSALPIALPSIQADLHASQSELHWIINAYLLSLAVLIILGGKLGDKVGHRKIFISGITVFIFSSILCAIASSGHLIIAGRILQGVGGALMMPAASPLFRSVVAPEEVGKMAGIYVSFASIFLILGPTLGGFLTEYLSWHWIFWLNFPLGIVAIVITLLAVPKDQPKKTSESFDWGGFILLTISLISLVYALMEGTALGWFSPIILICFAIFITTLCAFLKTEKKQPHPFLDLRLFQNKHFAFSIYILLFMQCVFMATVFWAIFFQDMLGMSAASAGILMLASQAPIIFSSHIAGRMFDSYGPRYPTRFGAILITLSSIWIAVFCWQSSFWWLLPALILFGIGSPFINLTNISSVVSAVPAEQRGMASGIGAAVRQIGGSVGLAVLGALMNEISTLSYQSSLTHIGATDLINIKIDRILANSANYLPHHPQADSVYQAAKHAYTLAFSSMMAVVTLFSLIVLFLSYKLPNQNLFALAEKQKKDQATSSPKPSLPNMKNMDNSLETNL